MMTLSKNFWSAAFSREGVWTAGLWKCCKKGHRQIHLSHVLSYSKLAVLGSWLTREVIKAAQQRWWRVFFFLLSSLPLLFCKALIWNGKYRNFVSNFHQKAIYTTEFWNVYFLYCNKLYFWWTAVLSHVSAKHSQLVLHQSWKVHY